MCSFLNKSKGFLFHQLGNLVGKVFFSFLEALALFKAREPEDFQVSSQLLRFPGDVLADGDVPVFYKGLVYKAVGLVIFPSFPSTILAMIWSGFLAFFSSFLICAIRISFSFSRISGVTAVLSR